MVELEMVGGGARAGGKLLLRKELPKYINRKAFHLGT